MANDGLCNALQAHLDDLQQVVDQTRAGECDLTSLWSEIDRVCQEIAYLSESIAADADEDDEDDDESSEGLDEELDFDEDEEESADFDEEDEDEP